MKILLNVLMNGLTLACIYFMVACGFSLIFGLLRTINLAHGSLYLVGAYVGHDLGVRTSSWVLGLAGGALAAGLVGALMQVVLLRKTEGDNLRQALLTVGFSIVVADLLLWHYGAATYQFDLPAAVAEATDIPGVGPYSTIRLLVVAMAVLVGLALWLILRFTKLGMAVRAAVDDRVMLAALGFEVRSLYLVIFVLGALVCGLAGVVGGSVFSVAPGEDARFLLSSLVVVIIGGMGSLPGAAMGALLVGFSEQLGLAYFPNYAVTATFGLMVAVLAVRPHGLFGRA
ncbi:branched-chain amino acid transport system permease protein [Paucibacter oligotrophus]|uniref:Branched-chain amino acid transport system permease protein n=1 Tax=Roseateles oligotrophus TaxID=1769250 RepID=A0A840LGM6_9BURK|nr:branched-chain amino acid ABC transporter permease [Roseateles oligotrophus]MBB4846235.1 branched-chain amino acid transport system permease protein [Roseateles oligotrophus]